MTLDLRQTNLPSKPADDYEVFDASRRIGRIMLHPVAPQGNPWFWTITVRFPQSTADRGYATTREEAMADFKAAWEREP
jgi:hypothetical protein